MGKCEKWLPSCTGVFINSFHSPDGDTTQANLLPVPEETLTHPPSWSSSSLHQLLPSTMIHSILPLQITCLAIFAQPLSMSSLVYLLVWSSPPHIPYISSPNQCLLFAAHAQTIATCFAVLSILYHLFLVFLSTPYLELCLNITHPSDHSHLCWLKCHLIFTARAIALQALY